MKASIILVLIVFVGFAGCKRSSPPGRAQGSGSQKAAPATAGDPALPSGRAEQDDAAIPPEQLAAVIKRDPQKFKIIEDVAAPGGMRLVTFVMSDEGELAVKVEKVRGEWILREHRDWAGSWHKNKAQKTDIAELEREVKGEIRDLEYRYSFRIEVIPILIVSARNDPGLLADAQALQDERNRLRDIMLEPGHYDTAEAFAAYHELQDHLGESLAEFLGRVPYSIDSDPGFTQFKRQIELCEKAIASNRAEYDTAAKAYNKEIAGDWIPWEKRRLKPLFSAGGERP